jgi:hypothetical protein
MDGEGQKLQQAGWQPAGPDSRGLPMWRDPITRQNMSQKEALNAIENRQVCEQDRDE